MPILIFCSSCNRRLRVPDELLGKRVKCAHCGATSMANPGVSGVPEAPLSPGEEESPETAPSSPHSIRTADDPGAPLRRSVKRDRDEEEESRPSRSRRRDRDWEEDEDYPLRKSSREDAEAQVAPPAIGLMVVGTLAIGVALLSLTLNLLGVGLVASNKLPANGEREEEMIARFAGGVCGALVGIVYGMIILIGAVQMKNLRSYALAMTASIVAMLPCTLCCLLGLPFGIWSIVIINRPEVRTAFR